MSTASKTEFLPTSPFQSAFGLPGTLMLLPKYNGSGGKVLAVMFIVSGAMVRPQPLRRLFAFSFDSTFCMYWNEKKDMLND